MSGAQSYTAAGRNGQSSIFLRGLVLALLALPLGGCAGLGLPFSEASAGSGKLAAADVAGRPILASAVVADQADPSDWEMVRRTAEGAPTAASRLDWANAITGSSGTLAIAANAPCRAFAVTINDMRGIRRYRGDACAATDGHIRLTSVVADDATLL